MQKNNIRNFICSFLFSVLAVVIVQKMFWHTQDHEQSDQNPVKPEKISLFSENKDFSEEVTSPNIQSSIDVSDIASLTAPQKSQETEIIQTAEKENISSDPELIVVSTDIQSADEIQLNPSKTAVAKLGEEVVSSPVIYADASLEDTEPLSEEDSIPLMQVSQSQHSHQITVSGAANASQIAMVEPETLISTMEEPDILAETKDLADADIKAKELGTILDITQNDASFSNEPLEASQEQISQQQDNPWVVAKGNKYAKNQAVVEEFSKVGSLDAINQSDKENTQNALGTPLLKEKKGDTKLAYQMIQNILIPIPEDIMNDADVTPNLSQVPDDASNNTEENPKLSQDKVKKTNANTSDLNEDEKESGLFKRISSWFGSNRQKGSLSGSGEQIAQSIGNKAKEKAGEIKDKVFSALGDISSYRNDSMPSIMPAELRLSFQPNRAEISGRTLKWIYAFADNARDNDDVYVEVRIDGTSSYALQQKRLNLLSSIFSARGVDYRKINTIFTSREPNSFIIRNIHFNNKETEETNEQR